MKYYLRILWAFFKNCLSREMQFKGNFLLWIGVELAWLGLQISFIEVLYGYVQAIAGWSKYEVLLLIGVNFMIQQIFQVFLLVNCINLPDLVRTGRLDFQIIMPINTQFLVSTRHMDIGALPTAAVGAAIAIYSAHHLGLHPNLLQLALFTFFAINGVFIHYALMFMIVSCSFWIVRAQGLVYGYYNLFNIARLPDDVFRVSPVFRLIFTYAVPMLIVANVPTRTLAKWFEGFGWELMWLPFLTLALLWIANRFWNFALRHYTSASS